MCIQAIGGINNKVIPSLSRKNLKWLNVVLDLNGILCVCKEKRLMPSGTWYVVGNMLHSSNVPHLVAKKVVFFRLSC